ncbi:DUF2478 domain-containing protein [Thauera sp.]|uniref:DUF2478 domain-containing protein n=1 Tax=Thauera sp. TaxID=1905334 RepID=UPI0039E4A138
MTAHPLAAIVYAPADNIELLLAEATRRLAGRGVKLGGVLQHDVADANATSCGMELENLETGERIPLSLDPGSSGDAVACRLDPDALARGAVAVRKALGRGAQLIVINKFASQEVSGAGLRDEIGESMLAGVPLLTAVGERFLDEWTVFTGGEYARLKPELDDILAWWDAVQDGA